MGDLKDSSRNLRSVLEHYEVMGTHFEGMKGYE